jgi:hypothetical protein
MNRQETAIGNGSRWLDGLGGPGRAVPRIIARSRDGNFPLPNVRVGSMLSKNVVFCLALGLPTELRGRLLPKQSHMRRL